MGAAKGFSPVKLFCGVIYRREEDFRDAKSRLEEIYSPCDMESLPFAFVQTEYYQAEMGSPLWRRFISFSALISPPELAAVKLATNRIEEDTADSGRRRVNLDPGYLSAANVVIATTKNYFHRVPLQHGIYAHLEYVFRHRRLEPLEWTYPDFRTEPYRDFFCRLRSAYLKSLRKKE